MNNSARLALIISAAVKMAIPVIDANTKNPPSTQSLNVQAENVLQQYQAQIFNVFAALTKETRLNERLRQCVQDEIVLFVAETLTVAVLQKESSK